MTVLGLWFCGGVFLDGWAHNHLDSALETFFTPWHAVMYSGFAACGLALLLSAWMNRRKGFAWERSLPPGYMPSLAGAGVFAAGGAFDMFWHLTFGIEKNVEALLSPAHLVLAVGAVLVLSGPFRAAWRNPEPPRGLVASLPMILSMAFAVSIVSFMTQFAHPVRHLAVGAKPAAAMADLEQGRAVAGFIFQLSFLTGLALLAVRRWGKTLPMGTFAIVFGVNMLGMSFMSDEQRLVIGAALAGLFADLELRRLSPSPERPRAFRTFAAEAPAAYALAVFVSLMATAKLWWSVHMWTGTIAMAGIAGLFLSCLSLPPKMPDGVR
uniref:Uncharacterized protein n=1 Tax=uncultured bacterium pA1 TaxID=1776268 RepID=A0A0U3T009_9BACT|nr:hypothetical protein [uncultured bacterium pA1]